jgi:2-polyprenyl-3-methyl-5-hydroxy-6-metoxy-1,4-benzoquinol methylase
MSGMDKKYQLNYSNLQPLMYAKDIRIKKANKTISVLQNYFKDISSLNLLDIGSSTGIMTNEYAKYFKDVTGLDLDTTAVQYCTNKYKRENLKFICAPIEETNFSDSSFDVITCTQIYEHVPSDKKLIEEIFRLLKPGGVCYFAAGNRFKVIEPHYKLPFLSFLPKKVANVYIRIFTKQDFYYENLKSLRNLKKLVSKFEIIDYTLKIIKYPSRYSADDMLSEKTLRYFIFNFIAKVFYFMIPTYIWILKKPKN